MCGSNFYETDVMLKQLQFPGKRDVVINFENYKRIQQKMLVK